MCLVDVGYMVAAIRPKIMTFSSSIYKTNCAIIVQQIRFLRTQRILIESDVTGLLRVSSEKTIVDDNRLLIETTFNQAFDYALL